MRCALLLLALVALGASRDAVRDGIDASKAPTISVPPPSGGSWWPFGSGGSRQAEANKMLLEAAQKGQLSKVKAALDAGADINACDHVGVGDSAPACFDR